MGKIPSEKTRKRDETSPVVGALRLGFVSLVLIAATVLFALGYPAAAILGLLGGAGGAAVAIIRQLR